MTHNILFFPFTHITRQQLDTVLSFFPSFCCFPCCSDFTGQPALQALSDQKKIIPLFLSIKEMAAIEQKVEQYLAWAQIHKGNEVNLKALLKDSPYFTSDTNVAAIKSQIKGNKNPAPEDDLALQQELLFLKMAHVCDEQNERIDLALKKLDKNRDRLVHTLRGLDDSPDSGDSRRADDRKDQGAAMTRERILAWSTCMAAAGGGKKQGERRLFVTESEAVFDYLEANCTDVVNALDIDKIKVHENECENKSGWQHGLYDYLMQAVQGDGDRKNDPPEPGDACALEGRIKLGLFSGDNINKLFNLSDKQIPVCLIKLKR